MDSMVMSPAMVAAPATETLAFDRKAVLPERETRTVKRVEFGKAYAGTIGKVRGFGYIVRIPGLSIDPVFPWRSDIRNGNHRPAIVGAALRTIAADTGIEMPDKWTCDFKAKGGVPTEFTVTFLENGS